MSHIRLLLLLVLVILLLAPSAASAQDDPHAACAAAPAYVPAELLQREVPLRKGVGSSRETITTKSPQAQAYYDQGLNYLESYVWIEAARSFHQVLRLDADCAMANLGLSYVHSGLEDRAAAAEYFQRAKARAASLSERERMRLDIREKQLAAIEDLADGARFLAYKKAIDAALAKHMEDPVFWILRGNAEEGNASGRGQRGGASSVAFYRAVLALAPDHATAHHYLVHSYETIGRIDKALAHGADYARLAPAIPHSAHMWGHDLRRVGRVDDAIEQFKKADRIEREYYAAEKIDPAMDWHHAHNLDLLASCYEHKGQMNRTEETLRESASLAVLNAYRAFAQRELPSFLLQRGRYDEALAEAGALAGSTYAQGRAVGHALAGQALVALHRMEEAKAALDAAQRELESVPAIGNGVEPTRTAVAPWVDALRGEMLLRAGDRAQGGDVLKGVIRALRAAPGPDAWSQGLFRLELMAHAAMEAEDWEFAEYVAAQMMDHDAAYGGSHYATALVLQHKGDVAGARREMQTAKRCWKDADADLAELKMIDELAKANGKKRK
jgi:tetratricopeptide (TPR) repeat protein